MQTESSAQLNSRLHTAIIRESDTIRDALASLDRSSCQVVLVADADRRIVGLMTDGDLRRAILRGAPLDDAAAAHARREFTWVSKATSRANVLDLMQSLRISEVPVLDGDRRLVGLHLMHDILVHHPRENWAVVMCGGRGTRLAPLTTHVPKPMLRVAGRPILERIVLHLVGSGIRRIFLAVHYLGDVIEQHFGNGERLGCRIDYLREEQPIGTAGALSLLPERPRLPVLVMNGDLMTQAAVGEMIDFHDREGQAATVATRRYLHSVPFGCVDLEGRRVRGFEEKPMLEKVVNAGVYVLAPELLAKIPVGRPFSMPELLGVAIDSGGGVAAWELEDDWIDVGQHEQLGKARGDG